MQVTKEELNPCTVRLTVVCDDTQVHEGFDRAYKDLSKRIRVPGFRPGQAPKAVVQKMVAKEDVYDFAAEHIVRGAYKAAIEQEKLEPHSSPAVELQKLDEDSAACEFVAKVPLAPQVELAEYKGLSAEKPVVQVKDEEIDRQVEDLRRRKSTHIKITDRGVQQGDVAVVNVKPEETEGDGRNFMTIAGQTFPELDAALLGMSVEEMKLVELPFPENFQEKDWAGKTLKSKVTLRSLSAVQLPEVDEEFAKAHQSGSVEELRERITKGITAAKEAMVEEYVNEQLLETLVKESNICVPDTMWEGVATRRLAEIEAEQKQKGSTLQDYAIEQGMTADALVNEVRDQAKKSVMRAVAVQEIFRKEDIKLVPEDLNRELVVMAREFGIEPGDLLNQLRKNNAVEELQYRAMNRKVVDFLRENANLTDVRLDES